MADPGVIDLSPSLQPGSHPQQEGDWPQSINKGKPNADAVAVAVIYGAAPIVKVVLPGDLGMH